MYLNLHKCAFHLIHSVWERALIVSPERPKIRNSNHIINIRNEITYRRRIEKIFAFFMPLLLGVRSSVRLFARTATRTDFVWYHFCVVLWLCLYLFTKLSISTIRPGVCVELCEWFIFLLWRAPIQNSIWWQWFVKRFLKSHHVCYFWHINDNNDDDTKEPRQHKHQSSCACMCVMSEINIGAMKICRIIILGQLVVPRHV